MGQAQGEQAQAGQAGEAGYWRLGKLATGQVAQATGSWLRDELASGQAGFWTSRLRDELASTSGHVGYWSSWLPGQVGDWTSRLRDKLLWTNWLLCTPELPAIGPLGRRFGKSRSWPRPGRARFSCHVALSGTRVRGAVTCVGSGSS